MLMSTWLNGMGLVLGILGALLVFRFGVPAYPDKASAGVIHLILEEADEEEKAAVTKAARVAKLGAALLALAFGFQFVALFVD